MAFPYKIIDLTHSLSEEAPRWDEFCPYEHTLISNYDQESEFKFKSQNLLISEGSGTHLDAPAHFIPGGATVEELPLERLIAPCVVVDVADKVFERFSTSVADIQQFEATHGPIPAGAFVIVRTGWEDHWNHPHQYRNNHVFPSISKEAAQYLIDKDIVGIGIDTLSPDRPDEGYPVHVAMLGAGKYIVENVANVAALPATGSYTMALPIKTVNGTEAPIRLIGLIENR